MTVLLRTPGDLPRPGEYERWVSVGDAPGALDPGRRLENLGGLVESAFDAVSETWWRLGREMSREPSGRLGHTPACAANVSDFGMMLAWSHLAGIWARETRSILLVISDPWLFRHLETVDGITGSAAPPLHAIEAKLWLRGMAARTLAALRFYFTARRLRRQRRKAENGGSVLLAYAHPTSTADGFDGYFGKLLTELPALRRILHIDCPGGRAMELQGSGRTRSLHAWGRLSDAFVLPFARWKPGRAWKGHEFGWLVRRAAVQEAGTASGAGILWQLQCQRSWLRTEAPEIVAWPWENHAWEREFVRQCRAVGTGTLGYQHSVIGRQMLNYSARSNHDGSVSLPDRILTSGASTADQLQAWRIPEDRISVGGALRISTSRVPTFARGAPILVALPFDRGIASEMVEAARKAPGYRFQVKEHPMSPFGFEESASVKRTELPFSSHTSLSAVVYAATTVGLESLLAGIPTFRYRPRSRIALDILPHRTGRGGDRGCGHACGGSGAPSTGRAAGSGAFFRAGRFRCLAQLSLPGGIEQ